MFDLTKTGEIPIDPLNAAFKVLIFSIVACGRRPRLGHFYGF
jgi:hypothetical protein